MTNNHVSTAFGILIILAALAAPASALDTIANPSAEREFGAKLLVCAACHGGNGVPRNATTPVIWGQQESYLVKQLHDFQSGDRDVEVMAWMAKTLSQEEQGIAAAYFANKSWPAHAAAAAAASPPAEVALCQACHQQNLAGGISLGSDLTAPRLAGQSYEYLQEAMRRYAEGERTNNADMMKIMQAIAPTERDAIARYISGL